MIFDNVNKIKRYSPLLLRTGVAIIFLWFGFSQIKNPDSWIGMIPGYVKDIIPIDTNILVYMNGTFEVVFATLLLLGLYTRFTSLLLGLHLLHIVSILGYSANGARDFALAIATFSIFLYGEDEFCIDYLRKRKKSKKKK